MGKDEKRLNRQLGAIERATPFGRRAIRALRQERYRYLRMPLAVLLVIGSFAWFLPVLGLWMLPAGLLLLAVDVPALRPVVAGAIVRGRRRIALWRRGLRR